MQHLLLNTLPTNRSKAAALVLSLALGASGCAIGAYGTTFGRYTYTRTATVGEIYSLGAIYRAEGWDIAAILGINKSVYIYRRTAGALDKSEWHFIRTPLPEGTPICHTSTSFGIEVDGGPRRNGIAAGLLTQAVSSVPDKRDSGVLSARI